jgi:isocitrate dehydrogenase (NAD+)
MFEPVHGSAPKYTGMNRVNPIATIMAGAMMLDYLGEKQAAAKIENAVIAVLKEGKFRTADLGGTATKSEMADAIAAKLKA